MSQTCRVICTFSHTTLRLHLVYTVVTELQYLMQKIKFNFVKNQLGNTSHVVGQNIYFVCTLLRTNSKYFVKLHFVLSQLNILYSILPKYDLSNYVTLYIYQMLFWTECKETFGRVINCGESTWGCSALQAFHLIITFLLPFCDLSCFVHV